MEQQLSYKDHILSLETWERTRPEQRNYHVFVSKDRAIYAFPSWNFPSYKSIMDKYEKEMSHGYIYLHSKPVVDYNRFGAETNEGAFIDQRFLSTIPNSQGRLALIKLGL